MTTLVKYEAARRALAEAHRVDEVKDIRDKAAAMQTYAMQAKDRELIEMATDIKLRAERRAGELLREMPKQHGARGNKSNQYQKEVGSSGTTSPPPTQLSDIGITKDESSRWQKLAAMPEQEFEAKLTGVKSVMRVKTEGRKGKRGKSGKSPKLDKAREIVRPRIEAGKPVSPHKLQNQHGISHVTFDMAITAELARKEALASPDVDRAMLSMTAQEKLDAALRVYKRKLETEFHNLVNKRLREFLEQTILPQHKKEQAQAQQVMRSRKGIMDKASFRLIWSALHPDSRKSISDRKLAEAFDVFSRLEKLLLDEKQSPTEFQKLPSSMADWDKMRAAADAQRRAKRGQREVAR